MITFLTFLLCSALTAAPLVDTNLRTSIKQSLHSMKNRFRAYDITPESFPDIDTLVGEETIFSHNLPALYTIKDGVCIIRQHHMDSVCTLRTDAQVNNDEAPFSKSSVRKYRFPFITGNGMQMNKNSDTKYSVYIVNFRKNTPEYIYGSGDARIYLQGTCPTNKPIEIWLKDNAILVADTLQDVPNITIHVRDNSKILIKSGTTKNLYVSSPGKTTLVDLGGLAAENVVVNTSQGPFGYVVVNPTQRYFKIGKQAIGRLESKSALKLATHLATTPYKAKRFFTKSLPKAFKKTVKGVAVASGYAILTSAAAVSIMYGIFPAVAGLGIAAAATTSSATTFILGTRIRNLMKTPPSEVKRSI